MLSLIAYLTIAILTGLLIGTVAIDRRIQTDLEAELSFQRGRGDGLLAQVEADTKKIGRLHLELAEVRLDLRLLKADRNSAPVATINDADLDRLFNDPAAIADAAELAEVTDEELEKLFAE